MVDWKAFYYTTLRIMKSMYSIVTMEHSIKHGTDLVHETVIVGDIRCIPRSFGRSHFYDTTSQRPDITRPAIAFTTKNFGGHKGQGALQLTSKLARNCDFGVKTGSGTKITDA